MEQHCPKHTRCNHMQMTQLLTTGLPCRQDTWSDLQLLMLLNGVLVLVGGYVKATWIDASDEPLGKTIYQAMALHEASMQCRFVY